MADATLDTSSYPKIVNKLLPPPDPMQAAGQALNVAQGFTNLSKTQFDLANQQLGALHNAFSSILADPSVDNVTRRAVELKTMGIPDQAIQNGLGEFASAGNDPQSIQHIALRHIAQIGDFNQKLQLSGMAPPQLVDNGNAQVPVTVKSGANAGVYPAGGQPIPNQLRPADRVQRQSVVGPTGQTTDFPVGQLYDNNGNFVGAPGRIPVTRRQGSSPAVSQVPPPTAGPPSAAAGRAQQPGDDQSGAAPQTPAPGAPGGMVTALPPSVQADRATSVKAFTDLRDDVGPSRMRTFGLEQALDALRGTSTGLGTQGRQNILNAINALPAGVGKSLVPDSAALSNFDLAKKYLMAYASSQSAAGRSDQALGAALSSNPNVEMTNPAAVEVAQNLIGMEKMRQAQAVGFIHSGQDPGGFSNWNATEFGKSSDPKAFALSAMSPQERSAYALSLKGPAKAKFLNSVRAGLAAGVLSKDDLRGAPGGQ